MALGDDIIKDTRDIFGQKFDVSNGWAIPSSTDVAFDNQGKKIKLVALFVDIRKSTNVVEALGLEAAARMYKSYGRGITKIIRARGGRILSFNGDGIVGGFVGVVAENAAVLSGLNINWFMFSQMKPRIDAALQAAGGNSLAFDFGVGIDCGDVLIVKAGMKGEDNHDLVWAGNPVNFAVKVASQASLPYSLYVAQEVFEAAHYTLKTGVDATFLWEPVSWPEKNRKLWRTHWNFGPDYMKQVPITPPKQSLLTKLAQLAKPLPPTPPPAVPQFDWSQYLRPAEPRSKLSDLLMPGNKYPGPFGDSNTPDSTKGLDALLRQILGKDKLNKR